MKFIVYFGNDDVVKFTKDINMQELIRIMNLGKYFIVGDIMINPNKVLFISGEDV